MRLLLFILTQQLTSSININNYNSRFRGVSIKRKESSDLIVLTRVHKLLKSKKREVKGLYKNIYTFIKYNTRKYDSTFICSSVVLKI